MIFWSRNLQFPFSYNIFANYCFKVFCKNNVLLCFDSANLDILFKTQASIGLKTNQTLLFIRFLNNNIMETSVNERIKMIMEKNNISITSLSKRIGVAQTTLNRQISGEGSVTLATVCLLLNSFKDISAEWLLRGTGEIQLSNNAQPQPEKSSHNKVVGQIEIDNVGCLTFKMNQP